MDKPYPVIKLIPPFGNLAGTVLRSGLEIWRSKTDKSSIIHVQAPAGYGKTITVLQLLENRKDTVRWLSVSRAISAKNVFWLAIIDLFKNDIPKQADTLKLQFESSETNHDSAVISLCNCLCLIQEECNLVIDDFHKLSGPTLEEFEIFLDSIPHNFRVWILTRHNPSLAMARYALNGRLFEFRPKDLRLGVSESTEVLRTFNANISVTDCENINNRVKGWPAGVKTIGLLISDTEDPVLFLKNILLKGTKLTEYLAAELLSSLDSPARKIITNSVFMNPATVASVASITPDIDKATCRLVFCNLEKQGFFVNRTGNEEDCFQFDAFFRELVQNYVLNNDPEHMEIIKNSISALLRESRTEEAALLSSEHGLYDQLAEIIISDTDNWFSPGRFIEFLELIETIPGSIRIKKPIINGLFIWTRTLVHQDLVLPENADQNETDDAERALVLAAKAYSSFYKKGSFKEFLNFYEKAVPLLDGKYPDILQILSFIHLGAIQWQGEPEKALRELLEYNRDDFYNSSAYLGILLDTNTSFILCDLLRTNEALGLISDARRRLITKFGSDEFSFRGLCWINEIRLKSWRETGDTLLHETNKAILLTESCGIDEIILLAHVYAAEITAVFSTDEAYYHIDRALHFAGSTPWGRMIVMAGAVKIACWYDSPEESKSRLFQMQSVENHGDIGAVIPVIAECWAFWHQGNIENSLQKIEECRKKYQLSPYQSLELRSLETMISGDESSLNSLVSECRDLGLSEWLQIRTSGKRKTGEQHPFSTLKQDASFKVLSDDEIRGLIDSAKTVSIHGYEEKFNGRELQILNLMSQGASNNEISEIIYISINTVRWYARQIFAKLDVRRRGEAAMEARKLGLLE